MNMPAVSQLVNRLLVDAQALAALVAHLKLIDSDTPGDALVTPEIRRVLDVLEVGVLSDSLVARERAVLINLADSYLRQALDLIESPGRPGAWTVADPAVLQAQGSASGGVAHLIAGAGLVRADARILDVGTGVAGVAMVFCELFPETTVVGIDPWEPALELGRRNVVRAGFDHRIELLPIRVEDLDDVEGFDLVWLPTFFIPEPAIGPAVQTIFDSTRPGGVVVLGVMESPEDPLAAAVDRLFTVRSGGSTLSVTEARVRLQSAGFGDLREVDTGGLPLRLIAAEKQ